MLSASQAPQGEAEGAEADQAPAQPREGARGGGVLVQSRALVLLRALQPQRSAQALDQGEVLGLEVLGVEVLDWVG